MVVARHPGPRVAFCEGRLAPDAPPLRPSPDLRERAEARVRAGGASDPLLARLARAHDRLHDGRRRDARELDRIIAVLVAPWDPAPAQPMREEGR